MTHQATRNEAFPHPLAVRVRAPRKNGPQNGSLMLSQPLRRPLRRFTERDYRTDVSSPYPL